MGSTTIDRFLSLSQPAKDVATQVEYLHCSMPCHQACYVVLLHLHQFGTCIMKVHAAATCKRHVVHVLVFRPEMKFDGIGALIARIKTDAGIASKQLDTDQYQRLKKQFHHKG